ncbi:hypothetical protein [Rhodococcus opacus]|uniref:hypothetical protein n=1 Tax=Rhodococcus opacus TaxID=37919 RepID=UPI002954D8BB|nr:hypothetical protein [Rhodococcus opacus]MDV7084285.1 hypothetical protein [Rhodococcus opacus]
MFERHSTASRPRDDEPGEFLYLHPIGLVLALLSGAVTAGLVVLLGAWLATPLVGVGAAATLVATVGLAAAMLMHHRPRRHGAPRSVQLLVEHRGSSGDASDACCSRRSLIFRGDHTVRLEVAA